MQIDIISNKTFSETYWQFITSKYEHSKAFDYYLNDLKKGAEYCYHSKNVETFTIEIRSNSQLVAHVVLILHAELIPGTAYFGFLECVKDRAIFEALWKALNVQAKQRNVFTLFGPVNGSIWHSYRVVSIPGSEEYIPSEPITEIFYYDFLMGMNPREVINYQSAYRKRFKIITRHTRASYQGLGEKGLRIVQIQTLEECTAFSLFVLTSKVFNKNRGYISLNLTEFLKLYSSDKIAQYIGSVYAAYSGEQIVGFCTNLTFGNNLIMKTIAVDPEFQQMGIANALVYKIHADAVANGLETIYYVLIRKGNKIKYFPTDDIKILREYAAFEFSVL